MSTIQERGEALATKAREHGGHPMVGFALSEPVLRQIRQAYVARWLDAGDEDANANTVLDVFRAAMRELNNHA